MTSSCHDTQPDAFRMSASEAPHKRCLSWARKLRPTHKPHGSYMGSSEPIQHTEEHRGKRSHATCCSRQRSCHQPQLWHICTPLTSAPSTRGAATCPWHRERTGQEERELEPRDEGVQRVEVNRQHASRDSWVEGVEPTAHGYTSTTVRYKPW